VSAFGPRVRSLGPLAALTAGALLLRATALDRLPLWVDEAFTLLQVSYRPLSDWTTDVHPPLYYALLRPWATLSVGDFWLRLPSALLGTAAVPAVYAVGARLLGRAGGLWAAAFLGAMWLHVWHSREARMYPLLVLAFTLSLWGLVAGARDGRRAGWIVYAVAGAAMAWSHAVGVHYAAIVAALASRYRGPMAHAGSAGRGWPPPPSSEPCTLRGCPSRPRARERPRSHSDHRREPGPPVFTTIHLFTVMPIYSLRLSCAAPSDRPESPE
jgi:predicted membrane-bound mannosyltransferase